MLYKTEVFFDETKWVARFEIDGPDVSAQGDSPSEALNRLAVTLYVDICHYGSVHKIPKFKG